MPESYNCCIKWVLMTSVAMLKPGNSNSGFLLNRLVSSLVKPNYELCEVSLTSTVAYIFSFLSPMGMGSIFSQCAGTSLDLR